MAFNPGKIQIKEGKWSSTCTTDADLVANQAKFPQIRNMLEYADQRMLSTLLVSGSVGPYGVKDQNEVRTKLGKLDDAKSVGNNAYQFDVMGRIQKASTINSQVGATSANGTFFLSMADNYLVPGMNALFHGQGFQARVMSFPTGSAGNYVYEFQSPDGAIFDWATHVSPQGSVKTCMGGYTSYGEGSLRGYSNSHFPDTFINHTTIQRKTVKITGTAASNVLWLEYDGPKGGAKGWMYEAIQQATAQLMVEDEFQKFHGKSTMKSTTGTLLTQSRLIDRETGLPIIQGDGLLEQIAGGNESFGSGTNGNANVDDFTDMMTQLEKKSTKYTGNVWVCITGTDGYANAQTQMSSLAGNQNIVINQNVTQSGQAGGAMVDVGFNFSSFNVNGNKIYFIKHPMWDDEQRFTERGADGKLLQSSMYLFMNMGDGGIKKNIDILKKSANGISRGSVSGYINGLTGSPELLQSEEDLIKYVYLKEDMTVCYNTTACGIINKSAS